MGIYLRNKLDDTIIYLSSSNKGHQRNLHHFILGDLLSDTSYILWNFYGSSILLHGTSFYGTSMTSHTNYIKKYHALSKHRI